MSVVTNQNRHLVKFHLWEAVKAGEPVAVDTETTGLRLEQGDVLRGYSFAFRDQQWYVPVTHPDSENNVGAYVADDLMRCIQAAHKVIMWNSAFDRTAIVHAFGVEFDDEQVWDGLTVDWLMNESADHRLKYVGARVFGIEAKAEKEALDALFKGVSVGECYRQLRAEYLAAHGLTKLPAGVGPDMMAVAREQAAESKRNWATLRSHEIAAYAAQDARLTLDLYWYQEDWLADHPEYREGLAREFLVEGLAYRMRYTGVRIDQEAAKQHLAAALEQAEELAAEFPGVNLKSPKQVQELIYDTWGLPCTRYTKSGGRSTDKVAMAKLAYDPRVARLAQFRKLVKQIDAFYVPLLNKTGDDGRIHPSWNAHRTVTGRWSCSGPNLMQMPKEGPVKSVLVPDEGMVLISADLPNAELRIAAEIADCELWLEAFRRGDDLHQVTADAAGITRHQGKTQNYQNLYGGGYKKLAETLAIATGMEPDYKAARIMWNAYWRAIPEVKRLMNGLGEYWVRNGRLPLLNWPGRYRHRLNARTGFPEPEFKALNSVIQGSVAEAVKDWLLLLEPELAKYGARIVAQVHDSVVVEVPNNPYAVAAVKNLMQSAWDQVNPFKALDWPVDPKEGF